MANPPITIGPFDNVPAPGSPIRSDWAQEISTLAATVSQGTYTPTLTGMVVGATGTNTASWTFLGGAGVGAVGLLIMTGTQVFGSSGQTYPNNPTVSAPPGFTLTSPGFADMPIGAAVYKDTSASGVFWGQLWRANASALKLVTPGAAGSGIGGLGPTTPFTWAASDVIAWHASMVAART